MMPISWNQVDMPLILTFFALQNQENKTVAEVTSGKTVVEVMRGKKKHYR